MLNLVFMGSDAIALPALDWLAASGLATFAGVFTQPDRPAGRGQKVQPNAIKLWAAARSIPVFQPEKFGSAEQEQLTNLRPDLTLVTAYGHILRQGVLDAPRLGTFNLHTSILPNYRGASPIQTATACGDRETGVSLMKLVLQLDAGPVADVERVAIDPLDTAAEVEAKLARACVPLLQRVVPALAQETQAFTPQVESAATYCRRLEKSDGVLDFAAPAGVLAARINGLNPWPGCAVEVGGQSIRLGLADVSLAAAPTATKTVAPGQVLGADDTGLLVVTGEGTLRLRTLQRPGGRMLGASEFLRGFPIAAGTVLPSRPMPALVARVPFPHRKG